MKISLLTAVLIVFWFCFLPSANAQPGVLDQTFGMGGKVVTDTFTSSITNIVLQPDGKILAIGFYYPTLYKSGYFIARFNNNGSFDSSFANKGYNYSPYTSDPTSDGLRSIALLPNGKILALGDRGVGGNQNSFLIRYLSNGIFDSTFGINGRIDSLPSNWYYYLNSIQLKSNGKILLGPAYQLDSNFVQDTSFHPVVFYSNDTTTLGNLLQPDDKLIYSATIDSLGFQDILLYKLKDNGNIDSTFGINGFTSPILGFNHSVLVQPLITQPDGKIIVAGPYIDEPYYPTGEDTVAHKLLIVRYNSNGQPDYSFGNNGIKIISLPAFNFYINKCHLQPDGKILLTGGLSDTASNNSSDFVIRMNNNGSLDSIFGKKGLLINHSFFYTSSSLLQPDGKIVLGGEVLSPYNKSLLVRFTADPRIYYNSLIASTFLDKNSNGIKDPNESFFHLGDLVITKTGADTIRSIFNVNNISLDIDTGTYVSRFVPYSPYYNISPTIHSTPNSTYFHTDSVAFALQPIPGKRDASVQLIPLSIVRTGFPNSYQIAYENKGTDTITNGTIQLIKSNKLNFDSATPAPTSVTGDTLRWNISNLTPLETRNILVDFTVKPPPLVNIGDTVESIVTITSNKPDLTPSDDTSAIKQIVQGSYDPNDKTENHGGKITTIQVTAGEYLQYTIRFQNTGNDTAFNVYIRDTLDSKLDWSTMQIIAASSNYQMTMNDGNKCLFTLRNINLVDSNHNEPGSHGYIVYRIKPKATVQVGEMIRNTAAIYFDYNLPVLTNTETTTFVSDALPLHLLSFTARKENKTNLLNWTTTNEINVDHFEIERSANSRQFSKIGVVNSELTISSIHSYSYTDNDPTRKEKQETVFYRLKMLDKDGAFTYSPIRMINNNGGFSVSIYPNPAKERLQVQIDNDKKVALQLQVLSLDGKVLISNSMPATEGSILRSLNISALQKGSYLLKIFSSTSSTGYKAESVVKFEKM